MIRKTLARVAIAGGLTIAGLSTFAGTASAYEDAYPENVCNDTVAREDTTDVAGTATVYDGTTSSGHSYTGVCTEAAGGNTYAEVHEPGDAKDGDSPVVAGQTGNEAVDANLWGDGTESYGPATVWVGDGEPDTYGCAPAGDEVYGYSNGNNVTQELPTVYNDDKSNYAGVCGSGGYLQVNDPNEARDGEVALVEGTTSNDDVNAQLWGKDGEAYDEPASLWLDRGPGGDGGCASADDDRYGYSNGNNVTRELPTVYDGSEDGTAYSGVCGGDGDSRLQVNAPNDALQGEVPLVQGRTGDDTVDGQLWGKDGEPYGEDATIWIGEGPESPTGGDCAPEGDDAYGYSTGNNVTRELPTAYTGTSGGAHVGACGGDDYIEVDRKGEVESSDPELPPTGTAPAVEAAPAVTDVVTTPTTPVTTTVAAAPVTTITKTTTTTKLF